MLGTLVDRSNLSDRLARLIRVAATVLPPEALCANEDRFLQVKPDVRSRFRVTGAGGELGPGALAQEAVGLELLHDQPPLLPVIR